MYSFLNDYSEGAMPQVMEALCRTNLLSTCGYGLDEFSLQAMEDIRSRFACPNGAVHLLVGGTQTNTTAISAFLRPWECVIAAETAHINVHETGAIEARGHKILTVATPDGKLTGDLIRQTVAPYCCDNAEHMVTPRLVYISDATELGTVYSLAELTDVSEACRELGLGLYLDGARLGAALTAEGADVKPEDLARLCDAFYIGGTKNGLLFGEALVILREQWKADFRSMIKQCGGMLAKGRLLGIQFSAMLQDDLWLRAAQRANRLAQRLAKGFVEAGLELYVQSPTNQVFVLLTPGQVEKLQADFRFEYSCAYSSEKSCYRFVTSWATEDQWVDALLEAVSRS